MTKHATSPDNPALRRIDRALHELRGGYPVLLTDGGAAFLAVSVEYFLDDAAPPLLVFPQGVARLVLTAVRAAHIGLADEATSLPFAPFLASRALLSQVVEPAPNAPAIPVFDDSASLNAAESAALELVKLAGLLPSVVVAAMPITDIPAWLEENHILRVDAADVAAYHESLIADVRQVSIAHVPLKLADDVQVAAFRPRYGAVEHLAVIVGEPQKSDAPLVRVHSSCVTGDILGSLRCDCGEQLQGALAKMAAEGSGVLLYMNQEGRGIGIANKLRAYRLQDAGMDTLDANEAIGFAGDERDFRAAAQMLKRLGISKVRLLSNNPQKIAALEGAGIVVSAREPLVIAENVHNARYLGTKRDRFGHLS